MAEAYLCVLCTELRSVEQVVFVRPEDLGKRPRVEGFAAKGDGRVEGDAELLSVCRLCWVQAEFPPAQQPPSEHSSETLDDSEVPERLPARDVAEKLPEGFFSCEDCNEASPPEVKVYVPAGSGKSEVVCVNCYHANRGATSGLVDCGRCRRRFPRIQAGWGGGGFRFLVDERGTPDIQQVTIPVCPDCAREGRRPSRKVGRASIEVLVFAVGAILAGIGLLFLGRST